MPPILFQAMGLCKNNPSASGKLLKEVIKYYDRWHKYFQDQEKKSANDSMNVDHEAIEKTGAKAKDIYDSQSAALYHLNQAIRMGHPILKEILKLLKTASQLPEQTFSPFTTLLLFSLTVIKSHKTAALDGLKSALSKALSTETKAQTDAWLRGVSPQSADLSGLFKRTELFQFTQRIIQFGDDRLKNTVSFWNNFDLLMIMLIPE